MQDLELTQERLLLGVLLQIIFWRLCCGKYVPWHSIKKASPILRSDDLKTIKTRSLVNCWVPEREKCLAELDIAFDESPLEALVQRSGVAVANKHA